MISREKTLTQELSTSIIKTRMAHCQRAAKDLDFAKEKILQTWEKRVRKSSPSLQDSNTLCLWKTAPHLLLLLIEALCDPSRKISLDDFFEPAENQDKERAHLLHFRIEQVCLEYDVLRSVLIEELEAQVPLHPFPRDLILDTIFSGLNCTISKFAHLQSELACYSLARAENSEGRYLDLVNSLEHAIVWILDASSRRFIFVGKAAKSILGYELSDWLLDPSFIEKHSYPEEFQSKIKFLEMAIASGQDQTLQHRMIGADGRDVWFQTTIQPEKDISGKVTQLRGFCFEITHLKRVEAEGIRSLALSMKDISRLSEEHARRDEFIAMLTHDLRNPLASAKISAQILERGSKDPASCLNRIISNLNRADQMIRNLLDANLIHAGETLPLKFGRMDLVEVLKETMEASTLLHSRRINLLTENPITGVWSAEGLRRAVENLINNAVKYGDKDSPITISATVAEGYVHISVHNQGEPIPANEQAFLFDRFRRASAAEKRGISGWGLGLTLVKGIAEAHRGKAWVNSIEGQGTLFGIDIPIAVSTPQENGLTLAYSSDAE